MIVELEEEMLAAAEELRFEYAAKLRDEIRELRRDLRELARRRGAAGGNRRDRLERSRRRELADVEAAGATSPRIAAVDFDRQAIETKRLPNRPARL